MSECIRSCQVKLIDLKNLSVNDNADVYIVCFDMNRSAVPYRIIDCIEGLNNKIIIFFVVSGFSANDNLRAEIGKGIIPFLPENAVFRGIHLCCGQFSKDIITAARDSLAMG